MATLKKLNYETLDEMLQYRTTSKSGRMFEILNVDVKRLHDDHSEIQLGQEVAFVATFAIHITQDGIDALQIVASGALADCCRQLAHKDELLVVGADAELRSDKVPIDEDSVALWIRDKFTFTFLLNGEEDTDKNSMFSEVGRVQLHTDSPAQHPPDFALPWLKKLDIGHLSEDYVDVDVRIDEIKANDDDEHESVDEPQEPGSGPVVASSEGTVLAQNTLHLTLEAKIDSATGPLSKLIGRQIRLIDNDTGAPISFVLSHAGPMPATLPQKLNAAKKSAAATKP